jgi:NADPH-dependent 2,4-dienoyl-CoA reductase/sulfur reductase-like enzyme
VVFGVVRYVGGVFEHVVVVGASLAGLNAVEGLRRGGFEGRITVVGAEPHLPYDRPPLSKQVLLGKVPVEKLVLRTPEQFAELRAEWCTGVRAIGLRPDSTAIELDDGTAVTADGLIIATGSTPRRLPGQLDHAHVHELRTSDDAARLAAELAHGGKRVAVVGAGFIGLEAAGSAHALGNTVVVYEGAPAPLMRALGPQLGSDVAAVHAARGVEIRCGVAIGGFAAGGLIVDGEFTPADVVIVGIGVAPATDWLEDSGLELDNGVVCDAFLNAGRPGVYAAGDVCRWHHPLYGELVRVEHWTNAVDQGADAAANLLAEAADESPIPHARVPYFWSEQHDRRIQFLGYAPGHDTAELVAGSWDAEKYVVLLGRAGQLCGVLAMNSARALMPFRTALPEGISLQDARALV